MYGRETKSLNPYRLYCLQLEDLTKDITNSIKWWQIYCQTSDGKLQYFIGIVPPAEYGRQILEFQKKWRNNKFPDVVEPHITVKSQAGLNDDMTWIDSLKKMCSSFPKFRISLREPGSFEMSVVYLKVESPRIYELHRQLVNVVSPDPQISKQYFELDLYQPHLTLGSIEFGMDFEEIKDMIKMAEQTFTYDYTFTAEYVRLYEFEKTNYKHIKDIRLA